MRSLQAQPAYNGIKDVFKSVYKEGGVRALYRGVGMCLLVILHYNTQSFMAIHICYL